MTKLELHNDIHGRLPYTVVPSNDADRVRKFLADNGVRTNVEREVFRAEGNSYDFVRLTDEADTTQLDALLQRWNAEQRAAKRQRGNE